MSITLKAACYQSFPASLVESGHSLHEIFAEIKQRIITNTNTLRDQLGVNDCLKDSCHLFCSTMIESPFTSQAITWADFREQFADSLPVLPSLFINAYECASWGFALRYALQRDLEQRFFTVTVVDVNVYDLAFLNNNPNWERSGFGAATFVLEREAYDPMSLATDYSKSQNHMRDFSLFVKKQAALDPSATVVLPFYPEALRQMLSKVLGKIPHLPDLHAEMGHCFGSDPWISLIKHHQDHQINPEQSYFVLSSALNGYYSSLHLKIASGAPLLFVEGDA